MNTGFAECHRLIGDQSYDSRIPGHLNSPHLARPFVTLCGISQPPRSSRLRVLQAGPEMTVRKQVLLGR
jgi:hypothetical protein